MQEYEDDHVLATVTVVQDFDPDTIRHGPLPQSAHVKQPEHTSEKDKNTPCKGHPQKKKRVISFLTSRDICPSQP